MSEAARTLPAVSFTVAARLIVLVAGFAASILTARGLGVEGRGQYYAVMTLAAIIAQIGNLGLSSSNTFLAARDRAHAWPLVVNSVWVAVAVGVLTASFVLVFGDEIARSLSVPPLLAWALCVLAPAILVFTLCSSVLVANERFFAMNVWSIANAGLVLVGVAICTVLQSPSGWFVLATLAAALIAAVGLVVDVGRGLSRETGWAFDVPRLRAGLQFASRAYLALLAGFLIQRVGVALLTAYRGPTDIGLFSIAAQISDVLIILPTSMATVLFPMLIRDPAAAWARTRQAILLVAVVMLAATGGVWWLGEWAIGLVFGAAFAPSYEILLWLMPAVLAISVTSILSQFVVAEGFPRSLVALWLCGLALCAGAGMLLVDARGAVGAAQAQSISAVLVCAGVLFLTRRRLRLAPAPHSRA
jgi:O-antigen/teichoic acid export membrane protein